MSLFYQFSISVSKCSGRCNNINYSYTKLCIPNVVKNRNIKIFNLISKSNQTRHIKWHETCKCKCRLDASVCNDKQRWGQDNCGCECREELINKGRCVKGVIWNPSHCICECDKSCNVGE